METGRVHSVELLEQALQEAKRLGFRIREDALDGCSGGACQIKGQRWLFIDPSLSTRERLELVLDALVALGEEIDRELSAPLARAIGNRRAA
jgi:hypothetical protein